MPLADFSLLWQSRVVETQTIWFAMPKIFTPWPFTEKVCQTLS